ncbi:MAG: YicC/YloC family endoribonuclease, partial [Candidatus Neomarinimicrobiota bacterium]
MTGFGRGSNDSSSVKFTALIKAFNGRFLDIKLKGLELTPEDEKKIREIITRRLVRGTIYVNMDRSQDNGAKDLSFNSEKFEALENVLLMIQKKYGRRIEISSLINAGDLLTTRESKKSYSKEIIDAVDAACRDIEIMRSNEGKIMQDDLEMRLTLLENILEKI